jgi:hypothetical protein
VDGDDWFTLAELAGRLGSLVWVEEQLAELLRAWSTVEAHAPAAIFFATTGRHHRWHGEIVRSCLPTSPQLLEPEVVQPPTGGWRTSMATLQDLTDPDATAARLKSLAKVIDPWIDREIGVLLELARPVSDAPMMRWLRFVSLDHYDDGAAAEMLLAALVSDAVRFEDHMVVNTLDLGERTD